MPRPWIVPLTAQANADQFRQRINAIFAEIEANQPGFGAVLPPVAGDEGRLFYNTGDSKLYQLQSGAWTAIT